jgi:hypothetical protein
MHEKKRNRQRESVFVVKEKEKKKSVVGVDRDVRQLLVEDGFVLFVSEGEAGSRRRTGACCSSCCCWSELKEGEGVEWRGVKQEEEVKEKCGEREREREREKVCVCVCERERES